MFYLNNILVSYRLFKNNIFYRLTGHVIIITKVVPKISTDRTNLKISYIYYILPFYLKEK